MGNDLTAVSLAEDEEGAAIGPFILPRTEGLLLSHPAHGAPYRIDIALPEGEAPPEGWPSIWLLDASGCFATCVEALRRMVRRPAVTGVTPMAVVGIAPAAGGSDIAVRRRDFTTKHVGEEGATGGAEAFLTFLEGAAFRAAVSRLPLDPRRRTLLGHSLAGYFTLWALGRQPHAFRAYAAISPSIWWDKAALLEAASAASASSAHSSVLVAVGEWEEGVAPDRGAMPIAMAEAMHARRNARRMIGNARDMAMHLAAVLGDDRVDFRLMEGDDHASILSSVMPQALRLASG
ncbi:MAG: alpha/beta hydrolase-fold protein [Sphingobium sp.]